MCQRPGSSPRQHAWLDDVMYPALRSEIGMSQSDHESSFILAMKWVLPTCQGMSISLLLQAKSALLLENANHAFLDRANPSQPLSPCKLKCISPTSVTRLTCDFQVWKMSSPSTVTLTAAPATVVVPYYATKTCGAAVKLTPGCLWAHPSRRVQSVFRLAWASEVIWGSGFSLNRDRKEEKIVYSCLLAN